MQRLSGDLICLIIGGLHLDAYLTFDRAYPVELPQCSHDMLRIQREERWNEMLVASRSVCHYTRSYPTCDAVVRALVGGLR
jgi:hypothetical protein